MNLQQSDGSPIQLLIIKLAKHEEHEESAKCCFGSSNAYLLILSTKSGPSAKGEVEHMERISGSDRL